MGTFSCIIIVIAAIILIRNEIVFRARKKYLYSIHINDINFTEKIGILRQISYEAQLFDLTKWTYNQLFPTKE